MLKELTEAEFMQQCRTEKRISVYKELAAENLDPVSVMESLAEEMQDGCILESGLWNAQAGHYSFLAFGSIASLTADHGRVTQRFGDQTTHSSEHPFTLLREMLNNLRCVDPAHREFINGPVGFMTYDAIRLFESIPDRHAAEASLPDMRFVFYKNSLVFDHLQQKIIISTVVETQDNPQQIFAEARQQLAGLISKITAAPKIPVAIISDSIAEEPQVDISDDAFISAVLQAKKHIVDGDAFQLVLSRVFTTRYQCSPFEIYKVLRKISPAPYLFYLPVDKDIMLGASPEKFISVRDGRVENNPIAGTRQRATSNEDAVIEQELLTDPKELAEHMMLVDLARNDLGAVCRPGSVRVKELLKVKHFSHISHITSTVCGQLREDKDALDALAASFPAGTLTGAPKIRAMQIIDKLETSRRGLYGGAICRLDYEGNLDSCIAIRMAMLRDGVATVRAGAGVVYDSDPQSEANETRQKARGMLEAIRAAQEISQ